MRIAYIPGPGDLLGTHRYWRRGEDDPRLPARTYSSMFFDMCRDLGAEALVIQRTAVKRETVKSDFVTFCFEPVPSGSYLVSLARHSVACVRHVRRFGPDVVVIGGDFFKPLLPLLFSKVVLSLHNAYWTPNKTPSVKKRVLLRAQGAWVRLFTHGAIAVSEECGRQHAILTGSRRIETVIPRLNDETLNAPLTDERDDAILYVGRIEEAKGVFDLLTAFEAVADKHPSVRLEFAGNGSGLDGLKRRIAASSYKERISSLGRLDSAGVNRHLNRARLLVCPTQTAFAEGFPYVCAEALARGVPALVSDAVPATALLGEACLSFPAGSSNALAQKLDRLLSCPAELDAMRAAAVNQRSVLFNEERYWGAALRRAVEAVATGRSALHNNSAQPERTLL